MRIAVKHQAEYKARVYDIQRKHAEIEAIKNDLYSLFGISVDQSQKRGKLLEEVLNRFFRANDICVREAFEFIGQESDGIAEHVEGAIEIGGHLFLVEMRWGKEPLGIQEISPYLVRVFGSECSGGVLISSSGFSKPVITACKEVQSQRTVILCELEEIVTLLEQNGNLKDFLKAKIASSIEDNDPLVKPLSPHDSSR